MILCRKCVQCYRHPHRRDQGEDAGQGHPRMRGVCQGGAGHLLPGGTGRPLAGSAPHRPEGSTGGRGPATGLRSYQRNQFQHQHNDVYGDDDNDGYDDDDDEDKDDDEDDDDEDEDDVEDDNEDEDDVDDNKDGNDDDDNVDERFS